MRWHYAAVRVAELLSILCAEYVELQASPPVATYQLTASSTAWAPHTTPAPPGDLDDAVIDRMDEAIHFDLPGREQRSKLLALYLDKYISKAGTEQVRRQQQQQASQQQQ